MDVRTLLPVTYINILVFFLLPESYFLWPGVYMRAYPYESFIVCKNGQELKDCTDATGELWSYPSDGLLRFSDGKAWLNSPPHR